MALSVTSSQRGAVIGVAAAVLLTGAFAAGTGLGGSTPAAASGPAGSQAMLTGQAVTSGSGARITVTGTGNVTGTPDQLMLSMGVQTSGGSVATALARANHAVRAVTAALTRTGVRASDIQTSGLSIQPDYGSSPVPDGYGVSESIQVTLRSLAIAGTQIKTIDSQTGDFTRDGGKKVMEGYLQKYGCDGIDLLFAHNDDMALGAIEAMEGANCKPGTDIKIVSIDAVHDGMQALVDGKINFIVECNPLLGPQLMELVKKVVAGETVPQRIKTTETTFDQAAAKAALPSRKY